MKKLLFVPLFGALAWLTSCHFHSPVPPTPAEIIQQAHEAFPTPPALPQIVVPPMPVAPSPSPRKRTHVSRHGVVAKTSPKVVPTPIPYVAEEPSVVTPPECIFPLNLIPGCRPQQ